MIYLVYGDSSKIFDKGNQIINFLLSKKKDANVLKINSENFDFDNFSELISGQGLFAPKNIIYFSKILEKKEIEDFISSKIEEISNSENVFIFVEEKVEPKLLKKMEKFATKIQFIEKKIVEKKQENNFDLANAFGERDVKKIWKLYIEKIKKYRPEELHGIIWWQLKTILLVKKSKNITETGLKKFPYDNAVRFSKKYSDYELEKMADEMIDMIHQSRRNGPELEIALEKFLLKLSVQQDSNLRPSA